MTKADQQMQRAGAGLRRKGAFLRGLLGDFAGNITVADRPGYYYVRVDRAGSGYELGIFPGRIRALYNLPIRIETNPLTQVQYIAGIDDQTLAYSGVDPADVPAIERHAATHEYGGDDMLQWLHTLQLFPLRCQPSDTDGTRVAIQRGTYFAESTFVTLNTPLEVDLTAYWPLSGQKYVLVYLTGAGAAGVADNGAYFLADLGAAPAGMFWVAAVRLRPGDGVGWQDIVDLRFVNAGVLGSAVSHAALTDILPDDHHAAFTATDHTALGDGTPHHAAVTLDVNADALLSLTGQEVGLDPQIANTVLAGPVSGAAAAPTFRVFPFLGLSDTPGSYVGQAGKVAAVNPGETGLIFTDPGGGGGGSGDVSLTFQARYWTVDGPLAAVDEAGGVWRVMENFAISAVTMYLLETGTASSTLIDVDRSDDGGQTWTTLFTTPALRPELPAGQLDRRASSVPDTTLVFQGDLLRLNIAQVATGARGLSAQIDGEVHLMQGHTFNITLTTADTEYNQALPAGVRAFTLKTRLGAAGVVRWAFVTGKVATPTEPYSTLDETQPYWEQNLVAASVTLYFASPVAGTVVEVVAWA